MCFWFAFFHFFFLFCRHALLPPSSLRVCAQKPPDKPKVRKKRVTTAAPTKRNVMEAFDISSLDEDLDIASRDHAQRVQRLRIDAYREAIGEIAGEIYGVVYKQVYRDALEEHRREWDISAA
ncbi:hypothetical protein TRSC58_07446 [Trypanosoma rangeli SC58]|uniref:Uncharacterized protein n=1 Tax=Trypanosoma rangeli SC58 TaxID=429131 RepID=A0A061IST5_TRYRA|nr:hypothetical protein TRSC58_07446 [Trypanosoma rangeli SC58]